MRALEICEARSLSGQKVEFSAEVQSFWSTFKPGTKTILYVSQLSVNTRFIKIRGCRTLLWRLRGP